MRVLDLPVAPSSESEPLRYAGHFADIVPNGSAPLPWSIVLVAPDGCRRLSDHGSFGAAVERFTAWGLRKIP